MYWQADSQSSNQLLSEILRPGIPRVVIWISGNLFIFFPFESYSVEGLNGPVDHGFDVLNPSNVQVTEFTLITFLLERGDGIIKALIATPESVQEFVRWFFDLRHRVFLFSFVA